MSREHATKARGPWRFEIRIEFLPTPAGELYPLYYVKLKTKPMTWKRAQTMALEEEKKTGWSNCRVELRRLK